MISIICIAIALVTMASYSVAIGVFLYGLGRLGQPGVPAGGDFSILIAARNEERNIASCLDSVLGQTIDASRFEVIVIDDRSTDATAEIVATRAAKYANLRIVRVSTCPEGISPKKNAILTALTVAKRPIIVFTDADCRVKPTWLETIDRYLHEDVAFVQGLTTLADITTVPRALMAFQSVDFFSHAVVSAAAIGADLPINGNANNLAFRRSAFDAVGGYNAHGAVSLGDDDLLMQQICRARIGKVIYMPEPAAAVETMPAGSLAEMVHQRTRWGSVSVHYGSRQVVLLAGIFLFYLAVPMLLLLSFINIQALGLGLSCLGLKMAGELLLVVRAVGRMGHRNLLPLIIPASFPHLIMVLYAVLAGVFGSFSWKGQKMRSVQSGAWSNTAGEDQYV